MKIIVKFLIYGFLSLVCFSCGIYNKDIFYDIEQNYKIKFHYQLNHNFFTKNDLLPPINAKAQEIEKEELERFPKILKIALEKYPRSLIKNNLKHISISKKLYFYNNRYGASYDVGDRRIYLTSNGKIKGYSDIYLISNFHHELSSILLKKYKFPMNKWKLCNPSNFKYKNSDNITLEEITSGQFSLDGDSKLYKQGFLNSYSQVSLEEDFNEYSGMILGNPQKFKNLMNKYPRIKKKFKVWLEFYHSIDKQFTEKYIFSSNNKK